LEITEFSAGLVRGMLHRPQEITRQGLVFTHGAGGNCQSAVVKAVADEFAAAGFLVLRIDLPFRQQRRFGPPFPAQAKTDREALRQAVASLREIGAKHVLLGGHSYGGRQASILAAEDPAVAAMLLLLSYPLHPPNKPAELRTVHFPQLKVPAVFVHGTRDPFGTITEMQEAVRLIPSRTLLLEAPGAAHDLKSANLRDASEATRAFFASEEPRP
jgi:uncharacterized protein